MHTHTHARTHTHTVFALQFQGRAQYAAEGKMLQHVLVLLEEAQAGMGDSRERVASILDMLEATISALKSEASSTSK